MSAELNEMMAVVDSDFARGNDDVAEVAQEWIDAGFTVAEVAAWLAARCFRADAAAELRAAGVGPQQAETVWPKYNETIGYVVANDDAYSEQAVEFLAETGARVRCA